MMIDEKTIIDLRGYVADRMSEKRFSHTLGVENIAVIIGNYIMPDRINELRIAALLHDISKEYSEAEQLLLMKEHYGDPSVDDLNSPFLWHSLTAPIVVKRDFPRLATDDILSAVKNHTVGSRDMSVFDRIIMLSDYIEEGREYDSCKCLRKEFLNQLEKADTQSDRILALTRACIVSLDNTISAIKSKGGFLHEKTLETRDALASQIERKQLWKNKRIL